MNKHLDARTLLALAVTLVLWSSAFAGIRAALRDFQPVHVALLRFLVASTVLGIHALVTRMRLPARRDLLSIAVLGLVGITGYHVTLNIGELTVTAGAASLLIAAVPIFSALLATVALRERLTVWGWVGIVVSFAGVALIALGEGSRSGSGFRFDPGAALILLSAMCSALYFVFQKPLLRRYTSLEFTTYSIWAGTLAMLVFLPGLPGEIGAAPLSATLTVVYLGVFPAAIAYATWNYALSRAPASIVSSFLYVNPVLTIFIAWVWLSEVPTVLALVGGAVALVGVVIVNTKGKG